jgi:hypothetical protein
MKAKCTAVAATMLVMVAALDAQAQARPASENADRFIGTYVLNVAKSTYEGAPAPKSSIRTFDYERDGTILVTVHTTSATGSASFVHFLITLDGREYEELSRGGGGHSKTTVSARKIDDSNIEATFSRDGKPYIWHSWNISADGKIQTVKRKSTTSDGKPTNFVQIYERQ